MPAPERGPFSRENLQREAGFSGSYAGTVRPGLTPLRLSPQLGRTGGTQGGGDAAAGDGPAPVPAGAGSGVADQANPLRIDAYAAIAATLDPATRAVFEEAVATLRSLKLGREQVEAKLKETGREDAIRTVTGTSALDAAIERTEAIIRLLGQQGQMRQLADEAERI